MADLLPSSPDVETDPSDEPRVIGLDSDDADTMLSALSSDTARAVLGALHDDPDTPSALADRVDTSLQNVQYHLSNLEDAGLVEVAGTAYSEKGREMKVYAPADGPLVVVAGNDEDAAGLQTALSRLIGGLGVLGVASLALDRLARGDTPLPFAMGSSGANGGSEPDVGYTGQSSGSTSSGGAGAAGGSSGGTTTSAPAPQVGGSDAGATAATTRAPTATTTATNGGGGGGGPSIAEATARADSTATQTATSTPTAQPTATHVATDTTAASGGTATPTSAHGAAQTVTDAAGHGAHLLDWGSMVHALAPSPGLLFFLGGTTVLLGGFAYWYVR